MTMSTGKDKALWAFDFDGVICDSCGESSISAWKAAANFWPEVFADQKIQARYQDILDKMHIVRPVIETGFENLVQVRLLLDNVECQDILDNWHTLLPQYMEKNNLDKAELIEYFGSTRDEWMEQDFDGWVNANSIYGGILEPFKKALEEHDCYIVTTKQERFAHAILKKLGGIDFPLDRLYSTTLTSKPKYEIL